MSSSIETVAADLHRLLAEEAHLIGQEVQDALGHHELHRLHELSAALDELGERFERRRSPRPTC